MAESGTIKTNAYVDSVGGQWRVAFNWTAVQSIESNTSTILWELALEAPDYGWVRVSDLRITFDGEAIYERISGGHNDVKNGDIIASGTQTVSHNSDGTKSIFAEVGAGIYVWAINKTGSGTIVLDNIPRQAKITYASNFTDITSPSFHYENNAASAADILQACISLDGETEAIAYRDIPKDGKSYTFSLTDQERETLISETVSDPPQRPVFYLLKSQIGENIMTDRMAAVFTVAKTERTSPQIELYAEPTGVTLPSGASVRYIQGKSRMQVAITATAMLGAEIISYRSVLDGKEYAEAEFTSDVLAQSGRRTLSVTVTDSRGFSHTYTRSVTVVAYAPPALIPHTDETRIICARAESDGSLSVSGTCLKIKVGGQYTAIDTFNACEIRYRYRVSGAQEWMTDGEDGWQTLLSASDSEKQVDIIVDSTIFDILTQYEVQLAASDYFEDSSPIIYQIPTEEVPLHLAQGGLGVGLGGFADAGRPRSVTLHWDTYYKGSELMELMHPVGSIYISISEENPVSIFGGTWEQMETTLEAVYMWKRTA